MQVGNALYRDKQDFPEIVPVFPLSGALLLPGGQLPLNIFEPRYIALFDAAMAADRLVGMVQPLAETKIRAMAKQDADPSHDTDPVLAQVGGLGRIVSFNETGDGRYVVTLAGICRFRVMEEIHALVPFRQCRIAPFLADLDEAREEDTVNRDLLLRTFKAYLDANQMDADWDSVKRANNHTLVNALSMMSPFGPAEKQALLEAPDLKTRAETLIAITEVTLARDGDTGGSVKLQ
jgi:Lon protease-like protein